MLACNSGLCVAGARAHGDHTLPQGGDPHLARGGATGGLRGWQGANSSPCTSIVTSKRVSPAIDLQAVPILPQLFAPFGTPRLGHTPVVL
eukprot:3621128-Pleurochrysis_carterae.AAC.1